MIQLPEAETECTSEDITYSAQLNDASVFVDFDSSLPSLTVKTGGLSNLALKQYKIEYKATDECDKDSDTLTVEIKLTESSAVANEFAAKLLAQEQQALADQNQVFFEPDQRPKAFIKHIDYFGQISIIFTQPLNLEAQKSQISDSRNLQTTKSCDISQGQSLLEYWKCNKSSLLKISVK